MQTFCPTAAIILRMSSTTTTAIIFNISTNATSKEEVCKRQVAWSVRCQVRILEGRGQTEETWCYCDHGGHGKVQDQDKT